MPQTKQVKDIQERKVIWSDDKFNYCPDPAVLAQIQQALNTNQTLSVSFVKNAKGFWDVKAVTPVAPITSTSTTIPITSAAVSPVAIGGDTLTPYHEVSTHEVSPQEHGMWMKEIEKRLAEEDRKGREIVREYYPDADEAAIELLLARAFWRIPPFPNTPEEQFRKRIKEETRYT